MINIDQYMAKKAVEMDRKQTSFYAQMNLNDKKKSRHVFMHK